MKKQYYQGWNDFVSGRRKEILNEYYEYGFEQASDYYKLHLTNPASRSYFNEVILGFLLKVGLCIYATICIIIYLLLLPITFPLFLFSLKKSRKYHKNS